MYPMEHFRNFMLKASEFSDMRNVKGVGTQKTHTITHGIIILLH